MLYDFTISDTGTCAEALSIAFEQWDRIKFVCFDLPFQTEVQDIKDGYRRGYFDVILIGNQFETLASRDGWLEKVIQDRVDISCAASSLIHEMLRLVHDPNISGLKDFRDARKSIYQLLLQI